jgi:hypothetical protein
MAEIHLSGIARIDRVVAQFDIWLDSDLFPIPKMKTKVLRRTDDYVAVSNLIRRDRATGFPDGIAGLGSTPDEALSDLLMRFIADARASMPPNGFIESDFSWSAAEDF